MTTRLPKPLAILVAAVMALYAVPLSALPAGAATIGGFEIDGNQVHDAAEDWKDLPAPTDGVKTSLPDAGGKTNRVLTTFLDNTVGGQDVTVSGSNNKEQDTGGAQWPGWGWTNTGNATGKSDYGRVAAYSYVQPVSGTDHVFLVLGFDRGSNVGGTATANYYFELNQKPRADGNTSNPNPNRQTGDIRITINDQGSGVFSAPVIEKWTAVDATHGSWGPTSGQNPSYSVTSNASGAINDLAPWWTSVNAPNGSIDKEGFIEASLDLSSFGAVLGCPSTGFTTLNGRSSTGASDKNLVDYFKATPINVPSSCASLFITKFKGDGTTPLGGATFKISPNPLPVGAPGRPSASFLLIFDDSDSNTDLNGGNYDDPEAAPGVVSVPGVIPGVTYTVTEETAPDGWIKDGVADTITPVAFGTSQSVTNTASFTNHRGSVTFSKDYEGADPATGASFILTRDNADDDALYNNGTVNVTDNGDNDSAPAIGVITVDPLDAGSWKLVEDLSPGKVPTGWLGDSTVVTFTVPDAQGNRNVTLANPTLSDPRAKYPVTVRKVDKANPNVLVDHAKFDLFRVVPGGVDLKVGSCETAANGECTVPNMAWGFTYYWVETSVRAPYNLPSQPKSATFTLNAGGSTTPGGVVVFEDPQTKIVTQATDGSLPGAKISDTATLSGVNSSANGKVTFDLYYTGQTEPTANSCVVGNVVTLGIPALETVAVTGNGAYHTGDITVLKSGYYTWVARYSGDTHGNRDFASPCDDTNETSFVEILKPGLTTVAQAPDRQLPGTVLYDIAKVTPVTSNLDTTVANVDFRLYGPDDATCAKPAVFTSLNRPVTVVPDGANGFYATAESEHFLDAVAGTYRWTAHFDGDGNNADANSGCNAPNESSTVLPAKPAVTTDAGADKVIGQDGVTLTDDATLTGGTTDPPAAITGIIEYNLYYFATSPIGNAASCTDPVATVTKAVTGNGTYTSPGVLVNKAGYYTWTAQYKPQGDANNVASDVHGCGLDSETVKVNPLQPKITTQVPATSVELGVNGTDLTDTATLADGTTTPKVSGSIEFTLYGPFEAAPTANSCTPVNVFNGGAGDHNPQSIAVDGNGNYTTPDAVHVTGIGYYTWVAHYLGDTNNLSAIHACGLSTETVHVTPRQPGLTTEVVGGHTRALGAAGTALADTATLSNTTAHAAGTISFQLYGPFDTVADIVCDEGDAFGAPVSTTSPVDGDGTYTSATVTVHASGVYTWVAVYSGDANNLTATHSCGQVSETVEVGKSPTSITTDVRDKTLQLPPAVSLVDTATLSGATVEPAAGGTITFALYGPFTADPTGNTSVCSGAPLLTRGTTAPVSGPGTYTSEAATVSQAGYYVWVATYSGDVNNAFSTHECGLANEITKVEKAKPAVSTVAVANAVIKAGEKISDAASVTGLAAGATGTVAFALYGPDDATCSGTAVFTSTVDLAVTPAGDGTATGVATSAAFAPTAAGTYRWIATYSGDDNNATSAGTCNDPNEQSVVKEGDNPGLDKFSNPASGSSVQPGSTIHYSVKVSNTGDVAITNEPVFDDLPPYVTVVAGTISDGGVLSSDGAHIQWAVTLAPGGSHTFTYDAKVNADAPQGAVLVNTARFRNLTDTTSHVVPSGSLALRKAVSPVAGNGVLVEFGDKLTYTLTASATGSLDQTNVVVTDYLPGRDPARPASGDTTYVAGTATCIGAGTCTVSGPDANGLITWRLGDMPAGSSRQITFQVTIDDVTGRAGQTVAVDILNAGAVKSDRTPSTPSNVVKTPVSKVLPVKIPRELPHTGTTLPLGPTVGGGLVLLGLGLLLVAAGGRRRWTSRG